MTDSSTGSTLRYRFNTHEIGEFDIHFRSLRDRNQFEDIDQEAENAGVSPASWPLFGVVWQAGEVLAQLMATYEIDNKRIVEIGCGVALASLVLNKRGADISATDYHPSAERHLEFNTGLNGDSKIPFLCTGWADEPPAAFGKFNLVIASDVIFEPNHAELLAQFIGRLAEPECVLVIVDAGRGYGKQLTGRLEKLGFELDQLIAIKPFTDPDKFKGKILQYTRH